MVDGTAYLATFARQQQGRQNWDRPRGHKTENDQHPERAEEVGYPAGEVVARLAVGEGQGPILAGPSQLVWDPWRNSVCPLVWDEPSTSATSSSTAAHDLIGFSCF